MSSTSQELAQKLRDQFGGLIASPVEFRGEVTLTITDPARIADIARYARETLGFDYLVDFSVVDNYGDAQRWMAVYELYGYGHLCHLRLKAAVDEETGEFPTVSGIWATADWHEREAYDMFGVKFKGHPDLRRILMWDGYPYFPLRKDFPLAGKPSDLPEIGFTRPAPLEGGPFVTVAGGRDSMSREPRVRTPET